MTSSLYPVYRGNDKHAHQADGINYGADNKTNGGSADAVDNGGGGNK